MYPILFDTITTPTLESTHQLKKFVDITRKSFHEYVVQCWARDTTIYCGCTNYD